MSKLPYSTSKADPSKAQKRIRALLQKFGVDRISFDEDFRACEISIKFLYDDYPVKLPVSYTVLADMYLEEDPWTHRKTKSEDEWIAEKREVAYRASFSVLEDFLKGSITMVTMGLFSFEEAFIGHFVNSEGQRLGEVLAPKLQSFFNGQLALKE